ncbi:uncharacterized protein METZ01_LOCUS417302 [marine metagenome]|uniref:Uncharacterized protein n=1 Tax=marine metagenome TaxID=408172 RepID=A0A382X245_9ZZZZ
MASIIVVLLLLVCLDMTIEETVSASFFYTLCQFSVKQVNS